MRRLGSRALRGACGRRWLQQGVHVPHGTPVASAAVMKDWPTQAVPGNFHMLPEQRAKGRLLPRDTGKIPKNFLLSVLYAEQPIPVEALWDTCACDSECVLEGKAHLRQVLKQCRDEGFVHFEKQTIVSADGRSSTHQWVCLLTRERYEDVRAIALAGQHGGAGNTAPQTPTQLGLRGDAAEATAASMGHFEALNDKAKDEHLAALAAAVAATQQPLRRFQRKTIDYLPYTDANGRVKTMWWYNTAEDDASALLQSQAPGHSDGAAKQVSSGEAAAAESKAKLPE